MRISGESAAAYKAVRLDSYSDIPGTLVLADDQTGEVQVRDKIGEVTSMTLGPHAIRIVSARR